MQDFRDGKRISLGRINGSGPKISNKCREMLMPVSDLIQEDSCLCHRDIAEILDISPSMACRILTEDIGRQWKITKWVPHTLTHFNKDTQVGCCNMMLEAFHNRNAVNNLIVVDEKWFYCRKLMPHNVIGSWVSPDSDGHIQTPRRLMSERKFMAIVAVSIKGDNFFQILEANEVSNLPNLCIIS